MRTWLALLCLLYVPASVHADEWVRLETPSFIVFGQNEKRARQVTAEFERFREAIGHVLPAVMVAPAVPTTVVVFESQRAFAPFRPRYNGKAVRLGGFFFGTQNENTIALSAEDGDAGMRIVFHEYTHLITANESRTMPVWVREGLAEFYSTFAVNRDGKGAVLGQVVPEHYAPLARYELLPLDKLLTVNRTSALYNEGRRRSIFYAQSWAVVHMLLAGEPNRSKEFTHYLELTAAGTSPLDAWKEAFGNFDAVKELKRYLGRSTVRNFVYQFPDKVAPIAAKQSKPMEAEVEAVLAGLLRYAASDDMEPRLARAMGMRPLSMLPRAMLGASRVESGDSADGVRLLLEAAADKDDWLAQYYVAVGLARFIGSTNEVEESTRVTALEAIDTVLAVRPNLANALALKARLARGAQGATAAARARTLAPGREDYVFLEALLRAELRDFPAARKVLAPLMSPRFPPDVRDAARTVMGEIVRREEYYAKRPAIAARRRESDGPGAAARPPAGTPIYRFIGAGERRAEGLLEKIECGPNGAITLVLRSGDDVRRFTAPAFGDIDFITYQDTQAGSVACGERRPADLVYLTWVPLPAASPGITGKPVAVELLPVK